MRYLFQVIDTSTLRKERQEQDGSESTEIPREASPEHVNCAVISEGQQEEQRKQDGKRSASLYTENINCICICICIYILYLYFVFVFISADFQLC